MSKEFKHEIKIYYEDTDVGGVVYYANYLKFLERARSEIIYSLGLTNKKLLTDHNTLIIVKSCNIKYKKPARFEDTLEIISEIKSFTKTSFLMKQSILRNNEIIIPRSNFVFQKEDTVVFLAKKDQIQLVENLFRLSAV